MMNFKKKTITFFMAIVLIWCLGTSSIYAAVAVPSGLHGHHALAVIDANSGKFLMGDQSKKKVYPASTTKIMTAIVLCEGAKKKGISLNKSIKITSAMLNQVPSGLSVYGLRAGQSYTLDMLLHMILINSSGDAAICACIGVFGSVRNCVTAMNQKVKTLGLTGTHFDNPVGLDVGNGYYKNYSTAYDIARITQYAMKNSTIKNIVKCSKYQVKQSNGNKGRMIHSTNKFYGSIDYDQSLYQIIGTKTGTTRAAGYVLSATAMDSHGHQVICTYMGKVSHTTTCVDIRTIFNKIFSLDKNRKIVLY